MEHGVCLKAPIEGPRVLEGPGNPSIVSPPSLGRCDGPYAMDGCYRAKGNSSIESWQSISAVDATRALCFQRIPALRSSVQDDLSSGESVRVDTDSRTGNDRHAADPIEAGEA